MAFNVLVVDDSQSMRRVIKKALEVSGFDLGHIFEASNGLEALAVLETEWADIILTDIHMPDMDGPAFLRALNKNELIFTTPVVVITTERREERVAELMALGAKAWIQKPFSPESIKDTLLRLLGMEQVGDRGKDSLDGVDF